MTQEDSAAQFLLKIRSFLPTGRILTTFEIDFIRRVGREIYRMRDEEETYKHKQEYECIPSAITALLVQHENSNQLIRKIFIDAGILNAQGWIVFIGEW